MAPLLGRIVTRVICGGNIKGVNGVKGVGGEKLIIGKPLNKAVVLTRRRNKRKLMQESYQSCYAITY